MEAHANENLEDPPGDGRSWGNPILAFVCLVLGSITAIVILAGAIKALAPS